ncbi:hypothetical protein [Paenibacillus sp. SYP-B4298]|uniref:hypothetical protein n=1 Tax=Paenibacillus sp. SYP-B4298 TaxID=2996034 RepID=UPI0022DE67D1|nr:hypothetical protein [Paenibacillus sp. SYP-B4298]
MEIIFFLIISFFLVTIAVKLGIDNSKHAQINKEILKELQEIRQLYSSQQHNKEL